MEVAEQSSAALWVSLGEDVSRVLVVDVAQDCASEAQVVEPCQSGRAGDEAVSCGNVRAGFFGWIGNGLDVVALAEVVVLLLLWEQRAWVALVEDGSWLVPGWLVLREVFVEKVRMARDGEDDFVVMYEDAVDGEREEDHVVK